MSVKNEVICYLIIIFSTIMIFCSCSDTDKVSIDNRQEESDGKDVNSDLSSELDDENQSIKEVDESKLERLPDKDVDISEDKDYITDNTEDGSSPWKLISESSVDTKVEYAGFLNEAVGVTVGYAGETSYTEDGGNTWKKSDNVSACRYGLDILDESFIVSCGNSGVNLVSNDKGKSWTKLGDFPLKIGGEYNKFLSVIDKSNIYIASRISLGVSSDKGVTWKELTIPDNCKSIMGMYFLSPDIGYLLGMDGTLYMTKDSCKTWTTQVIDLQGEKIAYSKMPSVAINFQDEEHGIIVYSTMSNKVYCIKTEDGGSTWEYINMPEVNCFAPYLSRDGRYLTLSSTIKKICLYKLEAE